MSIVAPAMSIVALGGSSDPTGILYRLLLAVVAFAIGAAICVVVYFRRRATIPERPEPNP